MNTTTTAAAPMITDEYIRDLPTAAAAYKRGLGDGLHVYVATSGVKSFRFNYRAADGRQLTHTVGKFGEYTLGRARAEHARALELLAVGECPRAAQLKQRRASATTLAAAFVSWFAVFSTKVGESYAARTRSVMESAALAPLMSRQLAAVEKPEVIKFCRALELTNSGSFARDAAHALDKIYEHARDEGTHKGDNPARKVVDKLTPRDSQHWEALQLEQLPLYFRDVAAMRVVRKGERLTQLALQLLPYLTVRQSILRVAEWSWVQWDGIHGATLMVPAFTEGTKQRRTEQRADKRGKAYAPYRVPLARQVVSLLRELQALTGHTPFLFPGFGGRGKTEARPMGEGTWLERLRKLGWDGSTEERGAITVHGFRALFATSAYTRYTISAVDQHAVEFQQDHKLTEGVRANYTRDKQGSHRGLLLAQRAQLLQWWADELDAVVAANGATLHPSRVERAAAFASQQDHSLSRRLVA